MAAVQTVLGPVDASSLGFTLPHEHIFLNIMREHGPDGRLNDLQLMVAELQQYALLGGRTIVELTSIGVGREPLLLREAAVASGLNIIMGTGFYRDPYLESVRDANSTDELADAIVREIRDGVGDTGIRPGIIGEVGSNRYISAQEERSLRAAARAHMETGLSIATHAAGWPIGRDQLQILVTEGVDPGRVIVGHTDTVPIEGYAEGLAHEGAYVSLDNIQGFTEYDAARVVGLILRLRSQGLLKQVLLSHDVCLRSHLTISGGVGYTYIQSTFLARLRAEGVSNDEIVVLTEENPSRALSGR